MPEGQQGDPGMAWGPLEDVPVLASAPLPVSQGMCQCRRVLPSPCARGLCCSRGCKAHQERALEDGCVSRGS